MKILHSSIVLGIAGSEVYLLNILPELKKAGVDVEFLALVPEGSMGKERIFLEQLEGLGIKTHCVYYSKFILDAPFKIRSLLREIRPDLVHTHLLHADFLLALTKSFLSKGLKLCSTKHGYQESHIHKYGFQSHKHIYRLYYYIAKWSEKQIDKSYSISKGLNLLYRGLGIVPRGGLELIHYGFNFNYCFKQSVSASSAKCNIVLVGRLTPYKGHLLALKAMSRLKKSNSNINLTIVGSGALYPELEAYIMEEQLSESVFLLGHKPNAYRYMLSSDIVLVPSLAEGFGVVALEAMAAKKALVSFDVPALNEHIRHNVNGRLVKPYDIEKLEEELKYLADNPNERKRLGINGYNILMEEYTMPKMLNKTMQFYDSLLS